jgi:hypothetical protein
MICNKLCYNTRTTIDVSLHASARNNVDQRKSETTFTNAAAAPLGLKKRTNTSPGFTFLFLDLQNTRSLAGSSGGIVMMVWASRSHILDLRIMIGRFDGRKLGFRAKI